MKGWIQHPDLSSEDLGPLSKSQAIDRFDDHDWEAELTWLRALKVGSNERCPPGLGLADENGRILRLCPEEGSVMLVHYHYPATRGLGKWLGSRRQRSVASVPMDDATELIRGFYKGRHDEFVARLQSLRK